MNRKNISLYRHNEEAYIALNILLNRYKKACIIHPTGTGKSIIAFKYIMDNPGKSVLWLSPSSNIYEIQKDTLLWMLDEEIYRGITNRIRFITYTKMYRIIIGKEKIHADIIILDEFHRCGARTWYEAVINLMKDNEDAVVIGLSADSIRYFDCRRDMAKELFDDNVASRMTLIEAINRKILPCPKYVVSESESDFQQLYEDRLRNIDPVRDLTGLEKMFEKYMKKAGRYIIFCSRYYQLDYVKENLSLWFDGIDKDPVVYIIKSGERHTLRTLRKFQDDDSKHLKLLLCVNILNEGIHIYGLNGVVFFRHTSSPNLYIQQMGRAMMTGYDKQPVIFDIVRNYSNLVTFDSTVKDQSNRGTGLSGDTSYEELLRYIDATYRLENGKKIISGIQRRISKTWESYYTEAKRYFEAHGNLNISTSYTTEKGLSLGKWLRTQKRIRAGLIKGSLSIERQYLLESIGTKWNENIETGAVTKPSFLFDNYDRAIRYLKEYGDKYGHMCIPADYVVDGFKLGEWIKHARASVSLKDRRSLTREQMDELNSIDFPWNHYDSLWNGLYKWIKKYYDDHGHITVPENIVVEGLGNVRTWIYKQRKLIRKGKLSEDKAERFRSIDKQQYSYVDTEKYGTYTSDCRHDYWFNCYFVAKQYYKEHGDLNMVFFRTYKGVFNLRSWLRKQRLKRSRQLLSREKIALLDEIGMVWDEDPDAPLGIIIRGKPKTRNAVLLKIGKSNPFPKHYKIVAKYKSIRSVIRNADKYEAVITNNLSALGGNMEEALEKLKELEILGLRLYFTDFAINNRDHRFKMLISYMQAIVDDEVSADGYISDILRKRRRGWQLLEKTVKDFENSN